LGSPLTEITDLKNKNKLFELPLIYLNNSKSSLDGEPDFDEKKNPKNMRHYQKIFNPYPAKVENMVSS